MIKITNPNISVATHTDITAIKDLLNNSYRGENSKQGWTTEAELIGGSVRADEQMVIDGMQQPGCIFLIYKAMDETIISCVNLQKHGNRVYLGMFGVSPALQGAGIGKQILKAAEEYASQVQCESIYMSVISLRTELIAWYKRHGYTDTGERKPFVEDAITGKHLQQLEFMILEKKL